MAESKTRPTGGDPAAGGHRDFARRDFLRTIALGAPTGVAAALISSPAAEAAPEPPTTGRYRETAHVKRVYATARF